MISKDLILSSGAQHIIAFKSRKTLEANYFKTLKSSLMIRSKTHAFMSYLLATCTPHLDLAIAIADSQYTSLSNPTDTGDVIITFHLE